MANKPLKSIQFPSLDDKYTVPQIDTTLAVSGAAADAKKTGDEISSVKQDLNFNTKILVPTYSNMTDKAVSIPRTSPVSLSGGSYVTSGVAYPLDSYWLDCNEGDEFYISGSVGSFVPWAFLEDFESTDTSVNTIIKGVQNETFVNYRLTAPQGAKHLIIQLLTSSNPSVIAIENSFNSNFKVCNKLLYDTTGKLRDVIGVTWSQGNINPNGSSATPGGEATRCASQLIFLPKEYSNLRTFEINLPSGMDWRVTFWNDVIAISVNLISTASNSNWQSGYNSCAIPSDAVIASISVRKSNNGNISPSDLTSATVSLNHGVYVVSKYKGKKISILGDSISTFAGANAESAGDGHTLADGTYTYEGNHCRYPNGVVTSVDQTYWMKLIQAFGMTLGVNDSWAGSCVSWDGNSGNDKGADIYIASPTRIGHLDDNGTPDIILVNAGTNDIGLDVTIGTFNTESPVSYTAEQIAALSVAIFADAYRAMLIRLQKSYPLAKIIVMLPNYTTSYYNPAEADSYLEIIKEACDYFGVPYIDMRTTGVNMYNTGTYLSDGIHPNVGGMNLLYECVQKAMEYQI